MKKITYVVLVTILVLLAGCVEEGLDFKKEVTETFENVIDTDKISLDFTTRNGSFDIRIWDNESYKIEVEKWARASTAEKAQTAAEELDARFSEKTTGGTLVLTIDVKYKRNTGANITAYVPRNFETIDLSTSNGAIMTEEIEAEDVSLSTSNGSIEAYISAPKIRLDTSNGRIKGYYEGDDVSLNTSNDMIDVECGDGEYKIETSNGIIKLETGTQGVFGLSTSNGNITIDAGGEFSFDLSTTNGTISVDAKTLTLNEKTHKKGYTAEDADLSFTATTTNGSVTVKKK